MLIREALQLDVPVICKLQQYLFEEGSIYGFIPEGKSEIEESINSYFLVAEIDGEIVGFISASICISDNLAVIPAGENYLKIDNLYVIPKLRRKGIGGNLIEQLLAKAKQNGILYFSLYSASKDIHGILRFYEKHKFQSWYVQMFQKL